MLIALSKDQKAFFEKEGYLELEGFFAPGEIARLKNLLQQYIPQTRWDKELFSQKLFDSGYDCLLKNPAIKKEISLSKVAALASDLLSFHPIRYAFDQLCTPPRLGSDGTIEEVSSVKGVSIACLISMGCVNQTGAEKGLAASGSIAFMNTSKPISEKFKALDGTLFWLIALGGRTLQYIYTEKDPHTHELKPYGYVFGDVLKQTTHPVLFQ